MQPEFDLQFPLSENHYLNLWYVINKIQNGEKMKARYLTIGIAFFCILIMLPLSIRTAKHDMNNISFLYGKYFFVVLIILQVSSVGVFIVSLFRTTPKAMASKLSKQLIKIHSDPFRMVHYYFFEQYIRIEEHGRNKNFSYHYIVRLVETKECIIMLEDGDAGYVIEKKYFSQEDLMKFQRFLISKTNVKFDREYSI